MSDATVIIWLIAVVIAFLGAIPYIVCLVITICKKQWVKLGIFCVVPILFYGLLLIVTSLLDRSAYKEYLHGIYDAEVEFGKPIFEYQSDRSFQGDGYSLEVYHLPDSIRDRFESADSEFLENFPKRPSYRSAWETQTWREAPFDPEFKDHLSFALIGYYEHDELEGYFAAIRHALESKQTFYAFFYNSNDGDTPADIDMFIVDLEKGRVYEINLNT